jgi:hypothetical protein
VVSAMQLGEKKAEMGHVLGIGQGIVEDHSVFDLGGHDLFELGEKLFHGGLVFR